MIHFVWDGKFKIAYRKKVQSNPVLKKRFWSAIQQFSENPSTASLRVHKLSGSLKGLCAFSISYDCRVIFEFISSTEVLLIDVGRHDEVY